MSMDLWLTGCPNEKSIQIQVWALFLALIHNQVWVQVQLQYVSCPYLNTHVHIYNIFLNITWHEPHKSLQHRWSLLILANIRYWTWKYQNIIIQSTLDVEFSMKSGPGGSIFYKVNQVPVRVQHGLTRTWPIYIHIWNEVL